MRFSGCVLARRVASIRRAASLASSGLLVALVALAAVPAGAATLQSITITPDGITLRAGFSQLYVATGHFDDGSTANVGQSADWSVSSVGVAGGLGTERGQPAASASTRARQVVRMARNLAKREPSRTEASLAAEFEAAELLTLGLVYEENLRFGGGAYSPVLKKVDRLTTKPLPAALRERTAYAARLQEIDAEVKRIVAELQARGMKSPYLRSYVVARINPVRFHKMKAGDKKPAMPIAQALLRMHAAAKKFDLNKVNMSDLAFVAASPGLRELDALRPAPHDLTEKGSLGAAGQSLLLFLRGHPEVDRVHVETGGGTILFVAGRPRGIAGLWVPTDDAAESRAQAGDARSPVAIAVPVRPAGGAAGGRRDPIASRAEGRAQGAADHAVRADDDRVHPAATRALAR